MSPDLTLAICLYNAEKYIEETLFCILNQTFQNFDLLVVNDCSTDNSISIVEDFFKQHPRQYELVNFKKNQGIAYARNYAIHHTTTKYILFIDADDIISPTLVEKEYIQISSDDELMGVSCWSEFINEKGERIRGGTYLGEIFKADFIAKASKNKLIFLPIHTIFDREIAISVGGFRITGFLGGKPRFQDFCEELDLWTRMSDLYKEGKAIITIPEILYGYRKGKGLSSNAFNMIIKMRYIKSNLLLRRNGKTEQSFVEFYDSLSNLDIKTIKRDALVADSLRNGVFYLKRGRVFTGGYLILKSVIIKPEYFWQKIKSNSGILKKNKRYEQ